MVDTKTSNRLQAGHQYDVILQLKLVLSYKQYAIHSYITRRLSLSAHLSEEHQIK